MKDLLETIKPVTKALQGRAIGYKDSVALIVVLTTIERMRTKYSFGKYYAEATNLLQKLKPTESALVSSRPIRSRHQSTSRFYW